MGLTYPHAVHSAVEAGGSQEGRALTVIVLASQSHSRGVCFSVIVEAVFLVVLEGD